MNKFEKPNEKLERGAVEQAAAKLEQRLETINTKEEKMNKFSSPTRVLALRAHESGRMNAALLVVGLAGLTFMGTLMGVGGSNSTRREAAEAAYRQVEAARETREQERAEEIQRKNVESAERKYALVQKLTAEGREDEVANLVGPEWVYHKNITAKDVGDIIGALLSGGKAFAQGIGDAGTNLAESLGRKTETLPENEKPVDRDRR